MVKCPMPVCFARESRQYHASRIRIRCLFLHEGGDRCARGGGRMERDIGVQGNVSEIEDLEQRRSDYSKSVH